VNAGYAASGLVFAVKTDSCHAASPRGVDNSAVIVADSALEGIVAMASGPFTRLLNFTLTAHRKRPLAI
jgi:hypothetical protein